MALSHFASMALFALLLSAATAGLTQHTTGERIKYAAITFALFMVIGVAIAWLLFPFSR